MDGRGLADLINACDWHPQTIQENANLTKGKGFFN